MHSDASAQATAAAKVNAKMESHIIPSSRVLHFPLESGQRSGDEFVPLIAKKM
jgi:hypothetical protein